jgi:hypothetical protein
MIWLTYSVKKIHGAVNNRTMNFVAQLFLLQDNRI